MMVSWLCGGRSLLFPYDLRALWQTCCVDTFITSLLLMPCNYARLWHCLHNYYLLFVNRKWHCRFRLPPLFAWYSIPDSSLCWPDNVSTPRLPRLPADISPSDIAITVMQIHIDWNIRLLYSTWYLRPTIRWKAACRHCCICLSMYSYLMLPWCLPFCLLRWPTGTCLLF